MEHLYNYTPEWTENPQSDTSPSRKQITKRKIGNGNGQQVIDEIDGTTAPSILGSIDLSRWLGRLAHGPSRRKLLLVASIYSHVLSRVLWGILGFLVFEFLVFGFLAARNFFFLRSAFNKATRRICDQSPCYDFVIEMNERTQMLNPSSSPLALEHIHLQMRNQNHLR